MAIQIIIDADQNEVGVFIPFKDWKEIKKYLPKRPGLDLDVANALQNFS